MNSDPRYITRVRPGYFVAEGDEKEAQKGRELSLAVLSAIGTIMRASNKIMLPPDSGFQGLTRHFSQDMIEAVEDAAYKIFDRYGVLKVRPVKEQLCSKCFVGVEHGCMCFTARRADTEQAAPS